ncbi:formyltransferase [uncultured Fretibacterium sp.]|uniref:formyltransferase n=1 Tax=uncultured Fretibacterium sp. TaxID=1678694 RepID=UPI002613376B|nr:formyltransferase [uncultured Fretibacterium sp.]
MSAPRRAVVFAYSSVGCVCLRTLLEGGVEVAAVYTHEDDPGEERWFDSVADLARDRGLAVLTPDLLDGAEEERIRALAPDLIFSFYYRSLIPERVLRLAPLGAFNMHGSLLPRYRGRACVNWAVLNGETETGVTLHHMTARADRGRIVDQASVPIGPEDTAHDVFLKLIPLAGTVLRRSLPAILAGRAEGVEQDESRATTFGRRRPADGLLEWTGSARALHDLVRAVAPPFPGAFTFVAGRKLFVWRTRVPEGADASCEAVPGTVLSSEPLTVATGSGPLIVTEARWEDDGADDERDGGRGGAVPFLPVGTVLGGVIAR